MNIKQNYRNQTTQLTADDSASRRYGILGNMSSSQSVMTNETSLRNIGSTMQKLNTLQASRINKSVSKLHKTQ